MKYLIIFLIAFVQRPVYASVVDTSGPTDTLGHPEVDLYDSSGLQRGTSINPLYSIQSLDTWSSQFPITVQDTASVTATQFQGQTVTTGTPTAGSFAVQNLPSVQTGMVIITGTWTGTVAIEVTEDAGVTWSPRSIHILGTSAFSSSITQNVVGSFNAAVKTAVRVRATAAITGTVLVRFAISSNQSNVYVANGIKIVDGTLPNNTMMAIKPGSTAPAQTDPAVVVTMSPNSPNFAENGTYNQNEPTITNGQSQSLQLNPRGDLSIAGRWLTSRLTGNATTTIKTGAGILHAIILGNNNSGGTFTLYDNTAGSGTVIVNLLAGTNTGGALAAAQGLFPPSYIGPIDFEFNTGLTIVRSGAAANDVTVIYK